MISLLLLFSHLFRRIFYELFLRCHQTLTFVAAYALWRHLSSSMKLSDLYLLVFDCTFLTMFVMQCLALLYRNVALHRDCSRALIARQNDAVRMTIFILRLWKVKIEQYVNVWISFVSLWSFLQSHSFIIAFWSESKNSSLDFLIESRDDFTRKLFNRVNEHQEENVSLREVKEINESRIDAADEIDQSHFDDAENFRVSSKPSDLRIAFFSESHSSNVSIENYEKVLMMIIEFEIAAQLPFLKELIQEFNLSEICTRNIHMMWQLQNLDEHLRLLDCWKCLTLTGDEKSTNELLNRTLRENILNHDYVSQMLTRSAL